MDTDFSSSLMPRTCFSRSSIFAARSGSGGSTFALRFTRAIYQTGRASSRSVFYRRDDPVFGSFVENRFVVFQARMDHQPATNPARIAPGRFWPWLVVLAVLLFVGFIRVRLLDMPLERDEGEYAYAGQLILQGIPPYELAYNMKLPGTYYAYALGMAVFGQTCAGVHLTLLAVNALTAVLLFLLARKLFGPVAGLAACASYALVSVSPPVLGMAAHATQFVALFAVAGTWVLWQAMLTNARRTFFFSGLLFGLAFFMKQPGLCFGLFGAAVILARAVRNRAWAERHFLPALAVFSAGLVLPFLLFCLTALIAGDFARFWFWTFDYAGSYVTANSFSSGMANLGSRLRDQLPTFAGFWMLAGWGLWIAIRCRKGRLEMSYATGLLAFSFLGLLPGFSFREHYFILLLPALALMVGGALQLSWSAAPRGLGVVPAVLFAGTLIWCVWLQRQILFQLDPARVCATIYRGNPFLESLTVGNYIREHSKPEARVAVIGSEPQIYFYAQRHSATGYIYTYPLMDDRPYAVAMQREMEGEIEAAKPEYVVQVMYKYSWMRRAGSDDSIFRWAGALTRQFYVPVALIGRRPNDEIVWLTGDDAKQFHEPLDQYLTLYQRRPDAN